MKKTKPVPQPDAASGRVLFFSLPFSDLRRYLTKVPTDVQEALLNAPDFLEEIVRSEAAGYPGGDGGSTRDERNHEGGDASARYRLISSPHLEGNLQNFLDATQGLNK